MAKIEGEWFGGEKISAKEKAILVTIDAARVRAFINTLSYVISPREIQFGEVVNPRMDYTLPVDNPDNKHTLQRVNEFFWADKRQRELLWSGITVEGLCVAFLGVGKVTGGRKEPTISVTAAPSAESVTVQAAKLWEGNASDGWDSGWHQHAYHSYDPDTKVSVFKPVDEWSASWNRGYYDHSLIDDPHFSYDGDLYAADVLLAKTTFARIQPSLGHKVVRLEGEKGVAPAYNFERQIKPSDKVYAMCHAVLTSYSSEG